MALPSTPRSGLLRLMGNCAFLTARVGIQVIRSLAGDLELEAAEVASITMKEAQGLMGRLHNVPTGLEDGEALPIHQDAGRTPRSQR